MTGNAEEQELKDRLSLIESMIAEGRRSTESWGWTFVLWGVAYYVAIVWSIFGKAMVGWPVTMIGASVLMSILISRKRGRQPGTTIGRAMSAIWVAMGISMFTLLMALSLSGRYDLHLYVAIIGTMLGTANATSSMILKWGLQFGSAVIWWAAAVVACFTSEAVTGIAFLVAIFFCQIVFGVLGMISEARERKMGASHA